MHCWKMPGGEKTERRFDSATTSHPCKDRRGEHMHARRRDASTHQRSSEVLSAVVSTCMRDGETLRLGDYEPPLPMQGECKAIRGNQWPSAAIRGDQRRSQPLSVSFRLGQRPNSGDPWQSVAIRGTIRGAQSARHLGEGEATWLGHQRSSGVIRGHQGSSEVISAAPWRR